ncbi:TKL family protein kinase [Tritrichomonas foetus]|uniref:TKL family protein kinase n=1 Tax=Tritrichomonas foetus TaxID=1144522 RepID=A0A1J4JFI9_9EUKA|nr:TKL family protein kinase [Tritrichomonas foetus]|eukprot:OHS97880.1 TKL family protein kinase [Tritrichomonas foetus]
MTQLNALPSSPSAWANYLSHAFEIVDDALSTVVFSRNKCQLIANELARFLRKLNKMTQPTLKTREIMRLFEFFKATTAFVGIISQYQANSWLGFFMNSSPDQSYRDLLQLWNAWSDCATTFCLRVFEESDALSYAHSVDLVAVYSAISAGFYEFPPNVQDLVRSKLEEIMLIVRPAQMNTQNETNKSILTSSDWEVITPNIGRGGYATVHLAKLKATGQEIAVKELFATQLTPRRINYLKREINSMRHLHHPNLLNMIGVTVTPPFCIATVYYPNGSLYDTIRKPNFTPQLASTVALDVARALEYLHAQGMIHRDLKPPNILMDKDLRAVVCDFGLTRMASPIMSSELGTVQWMAPEVLSQGGKYDNTIDVYAFGMILYEMAAHEIPFHNYARPLQVASKVMAGERPQIPSNISDSLQSLIKRCWAQDPSQRPSMHQVVAELETGTTVFPGADATEFRQWARKTSPIHKDAMESLIKQQSSSQVMIARLSNLSPLDPLAVPTLQMILDMKIEDTSVLDNIVSLAIQTASEEVSALAVKLLESLVQSETIDADSLGNALLKLWDCQPSFVVTNLKLVAKRLDNRQKFIKTILTQKNQNAQTVDAIEAICELNDLSVVFEYLDPSLVVQTLSFALTRFGPVKEMVPAAVTSYAALSLLLRTVAKQNKFQAIYLTEADSAKVESIVTMLNTGFFMNSAKDLQFIIENLSTMLHKGGPGYVTLDLLSTGAKFQPVAQMIAKMDFWSIIAKAFDSNRDDVCNTALSLASQLTFTEESIRQVWEPTLACFTRTHHDISLKLIQQFIRQVPKLDITGFIIGLLTALESSKPESYTQILFSFNFAECVCHLDKTFWRLISKEIPNLSTAATAAVALFALKYQTETQNNIVSYDFLGALLSFLYKQTAPFSCITPVLQEILNMAVQVDVAVFLTHHHFIQYLHQIPLRYPNEPKVTNMLLQFAAVFESVSDSLKSKGG